jgi:ADP-heptose:LPS heptosyltransferase
MRIFGTRMSLIGDIVMSLPVLQKLCEVSDEPYVYFSIAQKCKQAAPLFENHPLIQEIKISDELEDIGEEDKKIMSSCNIVLPVRPPPPRHRDWYNYRSLIEETTIMAGFKPEFTKGILPILYVNREIPKHKEKTVTIWPFAGYGKNPHRSPSKEWWEVLIKIFIANKIKVLHCGAEVEPVLSGDENYKKITSLSFSEQIYQSLGTIGAIGTDSGSMWVIGAYHLIPQINLLTNCAPDHFQNSFALAPAGSKCHNIFAQNGCNNIKIEEVCEAIKNNFLA